MSNRIGQIEGILFSWSEPLDTKELANSMEISENQVRELLITLENRYQSKDSGLRLVRVRDTVQLSTKPEDYPIIEKFFVEKKQKGLSNAGMETLSIIAYKQPVTRLDIEEIRGVNCDGIIRTLLDLGFIKEKGRLDRPGKPKLYGTTDLFLNKFGLQNINDLPPLDDKKNPEYSFLEENS